MGFAIAPLFVGRTFSPQSRTIALEMFGEIKAAFSGIGLHLVRSTNYGSEHRTFNLARLSGLDWLAGGETRRLIEEKIDRTTELFGYPDFIHNASELDRGFADFEVAEGEFLANQVRFHAFALRKNLRLLDGRPVDKSAWPVNFPPSTVNAFYMYSRNQILFPAGVLQPPLFSERQPMALNFGHIGTFMGHEVCFNKGQNIRTVVLSYF